MKTGKLILTICLGTVICIFCSGFVNAQPARGRQSNDEQTKWQKNSIADFTQQIESAYERGFKDGIAARDKFDKRKQTGKQKFNRNEKYTEGRNPKKNFRNNYNGISKKRSPSIYQWNLRQEHYQVRQDFHKPEWGFAPHRGFHEKGFHERGFHEKGFHDKDFAQAPPKKAPRGEKGQPPQRDFRKGDKGQLAQKNVRKGDIRKGDKGQLAQRDVRKGEPRKGEPRQGELRRPPLGGKRGDIAKAKDTDKKRFDKPEANKPNPNRNKRDVNKKDEDKKENQLKPSKQPKQQVPRGGRS